MKMPWYITVSPVKIKNGKAIITCSMNRMQQIGCIICNWRKVINKLLTIVDKYNSMGIA